MGSRTTRRRESSRGWPSAAPRVGHSFVPLVVRCFVNGEIQDILKYGNSLVFHRHKGWTSNCIVDATTSTSKVLGGNGRMGASEAANEAFVRKAYQIAANQD